MVLLRRRRREKPSIALGGITSNFDKLGRARKLKKGLFLAQESRR